MSNHPASTQRPVLGFHLLGPPQITIDGEPTRVPSAKAQALLIYLAVAGVPLSRESLADLLWEDADAARDNLRNEIRYLSRAVPDYVRTAHPGPLSLLMDDCQLDTTEFQRLTSNRGDFDALAKAVGLYRGDFLSNVYIADAANFNIWVAGERQRWRGLMMESLRTLSYHLMLKNELGQAIGYAQRLLEMDRTSDAAYRQLMELLARNGMTADALELYKSCRHELSAIGSVPSEQTEEVYRRILNYQFDPVNNLPSVLTLPLEQIPEPSPLPIGSVMPLRRNPLFVGRAADLKALAAALSTGTTAAVSGTAAATGLGGIGKTQLACEFVHRYGHFFSGGVFWMSFDNATAIPYEVIACGRSGALGLGPNFEERPISEQLRLVQEAWQSPLPRLLVFDNCEDPELLAEWRPKTGGCRILVTSRRGAWARAMGVSMVPLGILSRAESVALLQQHCEQADPVVLGEIAAEVGDLPLALHLAGCYLDTNRFTTPEQYLAELRNPQLLHHPSFRGDGFSPTDHDQHVGRTFALSYDRLNLDDPDDQLAHILLVHIAIFAPGEPIWNALLVRTLPLNLEDNPEDVRRANRAFDRLIELGIIKNEENTLHMHRLVAAFVREVAQNDIESSHQAVEEAVIDEIARVNADVNPRELQAWQTHLRFVVDVGNVREDEKGAELCSALGRHLWQTGDFDGALPYHQKALAIREKIFGPDDPAVAESLVNIGRVLRGLGKSAETKPLFERSLEIRMAHFGEQHVDTAESLENLGRCLHELGDPAAGLPYIERGLEIIQAVLGEQNELAAEYHNNIAYCLFDMGKYDEALNHLESALRLNLSVWGDEHLHTALSHNNLGAVLRRIKKFDVALIHLEKSLNIRRKINGTHHHDTANSLNALGALFLEMKKLTEAHKYAELALESYTASVGQLHVRTSYGHVTLGRVLSAMGNKKLAKTHFEHALDIRLKTLGNEHFLTEECRKEILSLN